MSKFLIELFFSVLRDEFRFEPQSNQVAAGEDIVLECSPPKGTPEPQVFWRKDGQTLPVEGRLKLVDGYNLAITDTKTSDDGKYQCVAKNSAGMRESAVAVLKVYGEFLNYVLRLFISINIRKIFMFVEEILRLTFFRTTPRKLALLHVRQ